VEFRVLGPLEVQRNGESLGLGGQKQRGLLAILLLNANEVVSTDRLIDELWGGEAPGTAGKALQVHVSQLRKVLEPEREPGRSGELLLTRAPGYVLQIEPDQLDLGRFERLVAKGREALASGDTETAARMLREALALWRGPPLAEFTYAEFAQREIARLEELRLAALEDRIQADLERGRHAELIGELEQLIADDPHRERPRGQLMLALYRSGRQAEALEAYRDARQALAEELGIEPCRELKELEAQILEQDPSLEPPARSEPRPETPPAERSVAPTTAGAEHAAGQFVGRQRELRDLEVALESALLGRGTLVLVGGEPGIGKSRLVGELSERARNVDAEVLWGRCWEAGGAPAYWPWVQALRAHVRETQPDLLAGQLGARGGEVAHILPELREVLPDLPVLGSPESEGSRFRVFDAAASFLKRAAVDRPLVLVLEDLHAADMPSLLLLQFVADEVADARLLVIGTYRDIELGPNHPLSSTLIELGRQPSTRALLLEGFHEPDVSRLIEATAGVSPSLRVSAAIHAGTGGNPLFIGELIRLLTAEGRLDEPIDETDVRRAIPRGIRDVIERRLERVSDDSREVLGIASVLGREFAVGTLAEVTDSSPEEILELLEEPLRGGVVAEIPGGALRMLFSHVLLRDALYDELAASRRLQLHRQIGDTLETIYTDDPEPHLAEIAHHYFEAGPSGDPVKTYAYAGHAGDRAARLLAYEEAVRLYLMALRAGEAGAALEDSDRCKTLLALGAAQLRAGDEQTARETFLAAAQLARALHDPGALAGAALGYGVQVWLAARGDRILIPLLEEALSSLEARDSDVRAKLMARLSCAVRDQPFRDRRRTLSKQAVEMARRVGDPRTLGYTLTARCIALLGPEALHEFGETYAETLQLAQSAGDLEAELTGHWWGTFYEGALGNSHRVRYHLEAATQLAEELKEPAYRWYPAGLSASLALFEGRFDEAAELISQAYELARKALTFNAVASYRLQMFLLHKERGTPPYLEDAMASLSAEYETYTILRCALASLLIETGRAPESLTIFEELADDDFGAVYVDEEWLASMTLLAEVCRSLGDLDRSRVLYQKLAPYAALNAHGFPEITLGSVERPLGILATMGNQWEAAQGHFKRAAEANARMNARPWVAHTQHDHGLMFAKRGEDADRERALELLTAAAETYRELAMEPWVKRAEADLAGVQVG
jgi:DNA-binding SARP family transcriptional activator